MVTRALRAALLCACAVGAACEEPAGPAAEEPREPIDHVDPFIGSGGFGYGYGSAFPGAASPHGMAKVGPDTSGPYGTVRFLHYSGYWHGDDTILGFSHLHLHGTGATDYGVLAVMPTAVLGPDVRRAKDCASTFDKATEVARPGYYAVTLDEGNIAVEITAADHSAHHRYTWPVGATEAHVVVDLGHHLEGGRVEEGAIRFFPDQGRARGRFRSVGEMSDGFGGYDVFFELRALRPWRAARAWNDDAAPAEVAELSGTGLAFALSFDPAEGPVELQVGLSFVSEDAAAVNLEAEVAGRAFEEIRARTEAAWAERVGRIRVQGGTVEQRRMFYSAMYRAFLMPTAVSDRDGRYRLANGQVYEADGFRFMTELSLWDTYRTLHPLYALVAPDSALESVRSLVAFAQGMGFFPQWPLATGDSGAMLGASAEIVVADSYLKGVTGFDAAGAYEILRAAALDAVDPPGGRGGRDQVGVYARLGYVPSSVSASVSLTTEYSHDDFALANLAAALGRTADADALLGRSRSYRNLYDPVQGFLRARRESGEFVSDADWDPLAFGDEFAEANAWQSLWMAPHDAEGLAELLGGREAFVARLTTFFEEARADLDRHDPDDLLPYASPRPYYWHGNEPDIHAAYLFAQVGRPDLTQEWVRWILERLYTDGPAGLPGNDDGGTLSAWYVFSALGFYPIPGSDRYVVGAPLFPRAEISVGGGVFVVEAEGVSAENLYVQSVTLNGAPLETPELRHSSLIPGGSLRFVMGPTPSGWGRSP